MQGVRVFYQEENVGFKDSLGTAGRRAGHTRLQRRLPLAPRPVSCFLACWPATYSTLPAPTYSSLLLISLGSKQLAAWAGCCWDPPSPIELLGQVTQPHRTRPDRSLLITLFSDLSCIPQRSTISSHHSLAEKFSTFLDSHPLKWTCP